MADDALSKKDRYEGLRRILVRVPANTGCFLDVVVKNADDLYKNELWTAIWAAGFRAVLGLDMEEVGKRKYPHKPPVVECKNRKNLHVVANAVLTCEMPDDSQEE